jgi:predicted DNA-binding transcriptional regulator AlpA
MTEPPRPQRIIRKYNLPQYLGVKKSTINTLIDQGEIEVFPLTPGGRAQGATEDNIAAYQQRRKEAARQRGAKAEPSPKPEPKPNRIKRRHLRRRV